MALRGERFVIDFSDDEDSVPESQSQAQPPSFDFVADIKERTPAAPTPPSAPRLASTSTGFPQPRKRVSAFKRQRERAAGGRTETEKQVEAPASTSTLRPDKKSAERDEKRAIAEENRRRIEDMSPEQVKREREELIESLPPSLLERFLRRANLDDGDEMNSRVLRDERQEVEERKELAKPGKTVKFATPEPQLESSRQPQVEEAHVDEIVSTKETAPTEETTEQPAIIEDAPPAIPPDLFPASEPPTGPIHFPRPPPRTDPMPKLDPSSPSFLADLQAHYFPETPHDPSSLSWLDPSADETPQTSAYHAQSTATSLGPGAIRFSLTGTILAPRTALSLPTTLGLHHHGDDPEAAGYTIPELAIFSKSSLPAQRCLAWQVLGRLLYRLGKGEFGERGDTLVEGLWGVVEREGVVARMMVEAGGGESGTGTSEKEDAVAAQAKAAGIGKHASARAWATEALWLWRQGSGGDRGLLKEGQFRST